MPRTPALFDVRSPSGFGEPVPVTAEHLYLSCRRQGRLNATILANRDDWSRLVAALRRLAKAEDLSVSTHTDRERSFAHRATRIVQVHKNGELAFLPDKN